MKINIIKFVLSFAFLFLLTSCVSSKRTSNDLSTSTGSFRSDTMEIWSRPSETTMEIDPNLVTESATETIISLLPFLPLPPAAFEISTNHPNIRVLNDEGRSTQYDALTLKAASQIQVKTNADALLISQVSEETRSAFTIFWYKRTVTVTARPIKLKFAPMSEAEADQKRALRDLKLNQENSRGWFSY